jgi:membrane protease YdiL (CAAX protease family)
MSWLLWTPPALFAIVIAVRLGGIEWGDVQGRLLLAILAAGVLVGFAEEMMFRGIFLRGMRTDGRAEGWAVLWTAIAFGALHLPNVFLGTGLAGLAQFPLAAITGVTLYLFRRGFGSILPRWWRMASGTFPRSWISTMETASPMTSRCTARWRSRRSR